MYSIAGGDFVDLLSVFGIGVLRIFQSFFNKNASKYLPSIKKYLRFGLYFESAAALFSLFYLCISGFYSFNLFTCICSVLMGSAFILELTTSLKALQNAPLALCTLCALGGGIILPSLVGIFLFDEPMSICGWLGVVLFFVSAYFLMPSEKHTFRIKKSTIFILLANFLINGVCGIVNKYFAVKLEGGNAAMFSFLSYTFAAVLFALVLLTLSVTKKSDGALEATAVKDPFLPKPVYLFGGLVGAVCASIVFFTTILSRSVSIIILNTVPNAICLIGSLVIDITILKNRITPRQIIGVLLNIIATAVIVIL